MQSRRTDSKFKYVKEAKGFQKKSEEILDVAWELIESVNYDVPVRWLFYRLYQQGFYGKKGDYANKCIPLFAKARKQFYKKWTPTTLVDDSRPTAGYGYTGYSTIDECFEKVDISKSCADALSSVFNLSHFYRQDRYVEVWFEAKAMLPQFKYYTNGVILRPFGGQYTVRPKWEAAKRMEDAIRKFGKPGLALYFGDCDKYGREIPENANKDIQNWCDEEFEFIFCGLTEEQAEKFDIPENPDKPGQYQWEAIPDDKARELITSNLNK